VNILPFNGDKIIRPPVDEFKAAVMVIGFDDVLDSGGYDNTGDKNWWQRFGRLRSMPTPGYRQRQGRK